MRTEELQLATSSSARSPRRKSRRWRDRTLTAPFYKIDRIHPFDIRLFSVRRFTPRRDSFVISCLINLAAPAAGGWGETYQNSEPQNRRVDNRTTSRSVQALKSDHPMQASDSSPPVGADAAPGGSPIPRARMRQTFWKPASAFERRNPSG
jgi:hypothetical protein